MADVTIRFRCERVGTTEKASLRARIALRLFKLIAPPDLVFTVKSVGRGT